MIIIVDTLKFQSWNSYSNIGSYWTFCSDLNCCFFVGIGIFRLFKLKSKWNFVCLIKIILDGKNTFIYNSFNAKWLSRLKRIHYTTSKWECISLDGIPSIAICLSEKSCLCCCTTHLLLWLHALKYGILLTDKCKWNEDLGFRVIKWVQVFKLIGKNIECHNFQ